MKPKVAPRVERFLQAQRVARLATVDGRGRPHVVPVVFAYAAGRVYTPIDLKPKKGDPKSLRRVRNIAANPHVQVLVDQYDEDWSLLGYVQLRGRAEIIERGYEYRRALRLLERRYPQYARLPLAARPVIKVTVERAVAWGRLDVEERDTQPGARTVTVDALKTLSDGGRASFRARVLRALTADGGRSVLAGDATGMVRVAAGRRRPRAGQSYAFENAVVREYAGGWRSVALDDSSGLRALREDVPVSAGEDEIERTVRILMTMARKRERDAKG
jgi:PPOX class probable F420-dependent enzyme